ncbi:Alpha/beta hydrolase family [Rubrobacter radiotolerans]|uniref:Acetoin dehydrogenase dihydrolipoyllysine-residue acetyltransferase subunit n=1 Tax=Rubrobacter radiotolerans TaxID=42256 RepID=A0A023X052_RUBRA|nr:acetoin dehydrogenase dihydrolipoyllysine-residue acetyltransferase subunit [Rubrobacter radiotolerans]AHY45862.1 Alpha/beta hydrolase family [Rubrobacter radiotolerans]MDX5893276.1 acetoin dehydrogenase dihydrolipoyllysine-residue acetyltransferase subunit [Rubrobacter radiotolerans]SMC03411.1 pyruvate dehydrogenase E2 component (dihydrolipoamide acetyltransferase) [Rubrobacter radiotolerans DSM 5868]
MSEIKKLGMPKWGLTMKEGTVVEWLVEEGAEVSGGDEIVEVESEKINNAVEAPAAGVLRRRVAAEGDVLPVGGLLGVIAEASVPDEEIDAFVKEFEETFVPEDEAADGAPAPETVEVGGRSIQFLKLGDDDSGATPLVMIPGYGGDINIFVFNQETLAADRPVYALDLPGHGGSTKEVGEGSLDSFVEVVDGFLQSQGIERAHLAGHSMGGAVATAYALAHPEKVASLILLASAGFGEEINTDYIEGFIAANKRRDMKSTLQMLFADPDLVTRDLVNDILSYKRKDGVNEALRKIADSVFADGRQARVVQAAELADVPVLAVWGSEDRIVPASHAQNLPESAKVETIEGKGHMVQMEAAGPTNRAIQEFLSGVE